MFKRSGTIGDVWPIGEGRAIVAFFGNIGKFLSGNVPFVVLTKYILSIILQAVSQIDLASKRRALLNHAALKKQRLYTAALYKCQCAIRSEVSKPFW